MKNENPAEHTITLIFATAATYGLWEVFAHDYLMRLPMVLYHWISALVGTVVALAIAAIATRTILRQRRELETLSRLKDDLTHMLVHDMRGPLTVILGTLQMTRLKGAAGLPRPLVEMLETAEATTRDLVDSVSDMLDISRMESQAAIFEPSECSPRAMVERSVKRIAPMIDDKHLAFHVNVETALPDQALLDGRKVVRILDNLLMNALKFTPDGGAVTLAVSWSEAEARLIFRVTDTGPGIPSRDLFRIFDKFYQVKNSQAKITASSGLGLAFCKLAAEAHGGSIRAFSEPGKGSTFLVELPCPVAGTGQSQVDRRKQA